MLTPEQLESKIKQFRDTIVSLSKQVTVVIQRQTKYEQKLNRVLDHLGLPRETFGDAVPPLDLEPEPEDD